ncbi:MAG: ATP-binding protein [Flavobacteriales bacterium]|nr:ATP-binding protein [Flavobacteriales bacterium]
MDKPMTEREYIERLYQTKAAFGNEDMAEDLAQALESLSSDIFTEYIRFLFELIQNADDSAADEVLVNLQPGHIVVAHNGKGFDEQDVKALCSVGRGTKRADQTKTGYKGIGFKSVFGKSKHVAVFSQGFGFKFTNEYRHPVYPDARMPWQIIPVWAERKDYPADVFTLPSSVDWNVVTVIAMNSTDQLQQDLMELIGNGEVLLFLRHLKTIRVKGPKEMTIARTVKPGPSAYKEVTIRKNDRVISEWTTHTFEHIPIDEEVRRVLAQDDKTPKKLQEATEAEISFAAKVSKGKITRLTAEESLIYTYLPTKVKNFRFPFLLNSSFLTNAGREELHDDRKWNEWLMEQAGEKVLDWMALLAQSGSYSDQILMLLPSDSHLGGRLGGDFYKALQQHAKVTPFVPSRSGKLMKASEALVDLTGLSETEFIAAQVVVEYFNETMGKGLGADPFIRSSLVRPEALKALDANFLEIEDLLSFFTHEVFKKHHEPEQNHGLINYFYEQYGSQRGTEDAEKLKHIPFIYAKGKTLRPPKQICFPSKADPSDLEKEVKVIHSKVYDKLKETPQVLKWLESLGVTDVSELSWLENEVLPKLYTLNYKDDYLALTDSLCKLHQNRQLDEQHYGALVEFRLLCKDGNFRAARECYLADDYQPELPLEQALPNLAYVDGSYFKKLGFAKVEVKAFFLAIGVCENIVLKAHSTDLYWMSAGSHRYQAFVHSTYDDRSSNWSWHSGGLSESHAFRHFREFSLMEKCVSSIDFSKRFFVSILDRYGEEATRMEVEKDVILLHGWRRDCQQRVRSYVKWFFENEKCYPGMDRKLHYGKDVYVNTQENREIGFGVLPVFDCEVLVKDDWRKLFGFRERIEMEDHLRVLEFLASEAKEEADGHRERKSDRKRIGLIYAKLASEIEGYSETKRETLRAWAKENVLLASDGEFALPSELKWVMEAGRKVPKGRIRTLLVPEECRTDEGFEQLLRELGVEIIDTFNVKAADEREDTVLMERLKPLVPFLALVVSVRQSEDLIEALERIETRRKKLRLLQCSDLSLVFKTNGEELPGEPMQCHREGNTIRYKGSWFGKSTLYELVPELAKALDVPKLHMDLMRLLQSDLDEIGAFMDELGADVSDLPADVREAALMGLMTDDEDEENIPTSSKNHLAQAAKNEANREARELVLKRLVKLGYDTSKADATHSVVNGVFKDGKEYPLVIKSYRNTSSKFNIRPNEWAQLSRDSARIWVHRGGGRLAELSLEELLAANQSFHVQFETDTFGKEGLLKFALAFQYVRNVHFQLDAPDFSMAAALDEYGDHKRTETKLEKGGRQ